MKHPDRWSDLLFSDDTFQASRWAQTLSSIELTSKNYFIGIGKRYPDHQLHVKVVRFLGDH